MTPQSSPEGNENKPVRRSIEVDMSSSAVDRRLRELGQLYEFGQSLKKCRIIGPVDQTLLPKSNPKLTP